MKYVIGVHNVTEHVAVAAFAEEIVHLHIAAAMKMSGFHPVSAGFYEYEDGVPMVIGDMRSESMGLGPKPGDDRILKLALVDGLTGLGLANMITAMELGLENVFAPKAPRRPTPKPTPPNLQLHTPDDPSLPPEAPRAKGRRKL